MRVLYVEDEETIAAALLKYLAENSIDGHGVGLGVASLSEVRRVRPDVLLVDIGPPGSMGIELCRCVRLESSVPIIAVSTQSTDVVVGLEAGADDFVKKPFKFREMLARIRSQSRRATGNVGPNVQVIRLGPLSIDPRALTAAVDGKHIALTAIEFECLLALAKHPGTTLGRDDLISILHGPQAKSRSRSIDVIVSRLRHKLGDHQRESRWIQSIRHCGYALSIRDTG